MTSYGTDGIRTDTRRSVLNRFCDNFCYFIKLALVHMKFAGTYADGSGGANENSTPAEMTD